MIFATPAAFDAWLSSRGLFHVNLGLARVRRAIGLAGLNPPPFKTAHVLGTNGKGSTSFFLESLVRVAGLKTGLFTSPHFLSPKERILVDGKPVADDLWLWAANALASCYAEEPDLTYFEFLTVMALLVFRASGVELAIMEAGLGGANDAVSAVPHSLRLYTPIAMDHADVIGPDIAAIARDKAAAMRDGAPAFSAPQFPIVETVLKAQGACQIVKPLEKEPAGWLGAHQRVNAALALAAWRALYPGVEPQKDALSRAFIPGRLQYEPASAEYPAVLLDGCHNPAGAAALLAYLKTAPRPRALIYSCLKDKDWKTTAALIVRGCADAPIYIPRLENPRCEDPKTVAKYLRAITGAPITPLPSTREALALAKLRSPPTPGPILICGSLYLLAEFYGLHPKYLTRERQSFN